MACSLAMERWGGGPRTWRCRRAPSLQRSSDGSPRGDSSWALASGSGGEAGRRPVASVRQGRACSGPGDGREVRGVKAAVDGDPLARRPRWQLAGALHGDQLLCGWPGSATPLWREVGCSGFHSRWWLAAACCLACLVMWLGGGRSA